MWIYFYCKKIKYLKTNVHVTTPTNPSPYILPTPNPSHPSPHLTPTIGAYQCHFSPSLYATKNMCIQKHFDCFAICFL